MTSIDERVVSMQLKNGQFLNGIAATINAMASLKQSLNLNGAKTGIEQVSQAMARIPPGSIATGIESVSAKFIAMSAVAIAGLERITNAAITTGVNLLKSLTVDPIKAGLEEYETNLSSIQTILANTGLEGDKGLGKVEAALQKLNHYSDQTIYNFSEMAKNIGTFTAAGIDLDTSTEAIKGIANLAAVSGSNAQQASTAMYQLSQSLSSGRVTLEDWNSVVNAGMGGKVFQESLKETAKVHGVAVDSIIKEQGSFRNSLQEGWITSEILTETLSKFTGDLTKSQLKTMGYNEEQIRGIRKMGETATDAATKVKTMSQLISTLQETAQSGWAKTWETIFGDFDEAKALFTEVNNVLGEMIGASSDSRNKLLKDWAKLGGRTAIIEAISNAFNGLIEVTEPIRDAFTDIFPPATAEQLFAISESIRDFTETIKIGAADAENLRRTFAGVFAVFSIAGSILKGLITVVGRVFEAFGDGSSSFLEFTGGIGDFLVSLDQAIKKSEGFADFFERLGDILAAPVDMLFAFGEALGELFGGANEGGASALEGALERIGARLEPFQIMGDAIARAWSGVFGILQNVFAFMAPFATEMSNLFGQIGEAISTAVTEGDFSVILDTLNTGLFAALVLGIRKFLSGGSIVDLGDAGGGFLDGIREAFGGLNDTLGALQANLKSGTLIKIATAVALLTASVVALSLIDSAALAKALGAMTVMFLQLAGAMAVFEAVSSTGSALRLAPMAAGLILLSTAILILSGAVKVLSTMSWNELIKGLTGLVVILGSLAGAVKLMSGSGKGLIGAGVGIAAMSVGIKILASAVKDLSGLSWDEMIRGLTGLVVVMGAVAGAMKLMTGSLPGAAAMLVVAPALIMMAGALKIMASMSWEEFAKSMSALAGGLLLIAGGLYLMTAALPGAAAMLVVAPALIIMAYALKIMGSMSWEEFGKSMAILAGALTILAVTLTAMIIALPGAAALLVAAAALAVLAPVLILFGNMSWEEIGKGLTMLAATLGIIGLAGAVLTPVIPTLLGLGAAIALIGIGTLAAGAGLLAFSLGLTALSIAGAAGAAALVAIVTGLISLIPMAMNAVAEGIVLMAKVIGGAGPEFVVAITTLLMALLTTINKLAPKIIDTIWNLVLKLANRVADGYPKLVDAALRMVTGILEGIAANIGNIVKAALDVITAFINGIAAGIPQLTEAGANLVITLVESLATTIANNSARMRAAGQDLAFAIVDGMTGGLLSGASDVIGAAVDMAGSALSAAKKALGIASPSKEFYKVGRFAKIGFANGLTDGRDGIKAAVGTMRAALTELISGTGQDIKDLEARLKEMRKEPGKYAKAIQKAESDLARARSENRRAINARDTLKNSLDDEEKQLYKLASAYDKVSAKLDKANQELADARRTRNDYNKSITEQYSSLGQIEGTTFRGFTTSLKTQVEDTRKFMSTLQQLRKLGLNDAMYEELLRKGPDALPLVSDILNNGKKGVKEINSLTSQLNSVSKSLGNTASKELYQAGVDAAAGLVEGLKRQQDRIEGQMERIANAMVRAIKRKLGIRSPSRAFREVGGWSVDGLVDGLEKYSYKVDDAAERVGSDAIVALERSLGNLNQVIDGKIELTPTIRPILDLRKVEQGASQLSAIMRNQPITVPFEFKRATEISNGRFMPPVSRGTTEQQPVTTIVNDYSFVQNNSSPKALSEVEIYRQTKNQISSVKGVLKS